MRVHPSARKHGISDEDALHAATWPQYVEPLGDGPLAVSHRTGRRKDFAGVPRRYDAIWHSPEFTITDCRYDYDGALAAGSDHALVTADLTVRERLSG